MKKKAYYIFWALVGAVLIFSFWKCPLRVLFGIPCPGCGMTRAFMSLIKGDIKSSLRFHPLCIYTTLLLLLLLFSYIFKIKLPKSIQNTVLVFTVLLFTVVWLIRLFSGSDIIKLDFSSSVIGKIIFYFQK